VASGPEGSLRAGVLSEPEAGPAGCKACDPSTGLRAGRGPLRRFILSAQREGPTCCGEGLRRAGRRRTEPNAAGADVSGDAAESRREMQASFAPTQGAGSRRATSRGAVAMCSR
jgi:hypothetical protein